MDNQHGILGGLINWFQTPFKNTGTSLSPLNWVLIVGLVIILAWMWNTVLFKLESVTEIIEQAA